MASAKEDNNKRERIILGIDPGTATTGFGLLRVEGSQIRAIGWGAWRPQRTLTRAEKLYHLATSLDQCIQQFHPTSVSIEQAFVGQNIQSALRLGEARGALMATCAQYQIPVHEYATATVKKVVAGNGRASKEQIQFMTQKLLRLEKKPTPDDAADALGLALTLALDGSIIAQR
ncbi:MAG: crossover junction endodeoxyribonuclease RuvC [Planctomycetota bacterium]|jgi:crossover junction endodeoxyribonuclease RuvC